MPSYRILSRPLCWPLASLDRTAWLAGAGQWTLRCIFLMSGESSTAPVSARPALLNRPNALVPLIPKELQPARDRSRPLGAAGWTCCERCCGGQML